MRTVSVLERRASIVRRHHLAGDATGPEAVARGLLALHATDPATVYLSVLARSADSTLTDVADAMYDKRDLIRWLAMRRTLFVVPRDDVALVQAAASTPLADVLRRRLVGQLRRSDSTELGAERIGPWLAELEDAVVAALERRGRATGAQLRSDEPRLDTLIAAPSSAQAPQHLTSSLLTLLSADGRIVRGVPTGPWTSRTHLWEPLSAWWADGLPVLDRARAQRELAGRWLSRFGPATVEDLQWWTGWTKTITRESLGELPIEEVDLHGRPGIALSGSDDASADRSGEGPPPTATLLPALDPTPMGWQHRDWLFGIDRARLYDRAGNVGPTLWWDGEIIGSWAVGPGGDIRTPVLADRGSDAAAAVERAAGRLHHRLDGAVVTPAARTPLETELSAADRPPDHRT